MNLRSILAMTTPALLCLTAAHAAPPPISADEVAKLRQLIDGSEGHSGVVAKDLLQALGLKLPGPFRSFTEEPGGDVAYEICALPNGAGYLMIQAHGPDKAIIRIFMTDPNLGLVSAIQRNGRHQPAFAMPIADAFKLYGDDVATWRQFIASQGQ